MAAPKTAVAPSRFGGFCSFLGIGSASSLREKLTNHHLAHVTRRGSYSIVCALDALRSQIKGVVDSLQDTLQTQAPLEKTSVTSVSDASVVAVAR